MASYKGANVNDSTILYLAAGLGALFLYEQHKLENAAGAAAKAVADVVNGAGANIHAAFNAAGDTFNKTANAPTAALDYALHPIVVDANAPSGFRIQQPPDLGAVPNIVPGAGLALGAIGHVTSSADAFANAPPGTIPHSPIPSPGSFGFFGTAANVLNLGIPQFMIDRSNEAINAQQAYVAQRANDAYTSDAINHYNPNSHGGF